MKGAKNALSNWYRKDENALLPVFVSAADISCIP